jgi:hypothetical protein
MRSWVVGVERRPDVAKRADSVVDGPRDQPVESHLALFEKHRAARQRALLEMRFAGDVEGREDSGQTLAARGVVSADQCLQPTARIDDVVVAADQVGRLREPPPEAGDQDGLAPIGSETFLISPDLHIAVPIEEGVKEGLQRGIRAGVVDHDDPCLGG